MSRFSLVVGATSGIGLATAVELAARGDRLTLVARPGSALDRARRSCLDAGAPEVLTVEADVNDPADAHRLVQEHTDRYGRLDFVVSTAAVMAYGKLEDLPPEVFSAVVDTAIHGTMHLARAVLPTLRAQGRGVFVIVNSLLGAVTVPNMGAYTVSKWGQRALARTLQQELRDAPHVHVCVASPGSINTPIYYQAANFMRRNARPPVPVLQPETAGRHIADLADRPRRHLSVPIGPTNPVIISGFRLFPRLYDLIVGPGFRLGAQTTPQDAPTTGTTARPAPQEERRHGHWPAPR